MLAFVLSIPIDGDDLEKSGVGFSRGLGGGYHKYWRRVRRMSGGKARWVYYYDDPKEKAKWANHAVNEIADAHAEVHRLKQEFAGDHPELKKGVRHLRDLTAEYLNEVLTWDKPPKLKVSDAAMAQYHTAIVDLYGDNEPLDPHGKPTSFMRSIEYAYKLFPPFVKQNFSGAVSNLVVHLGSEDKHYPDGSKDEGVLGYCDMAGLRASEVVILQDRAARCGLGKGAHMFGGMAGTHVVVHEMAHAIHNQIGATRGGFDPNGVKAGYTGLTWKDWLEHLDQGGRKEPGVTSYAESADWERWTESFTAALMYPKALARCAPRSYEFFRRFFGEDAVRRLHTDRNLVDALTAKLATERDPAKAREINIQIDKATGVLDLADDDTRLQWWKQPESRVQKHLREWRTKGDGASLSYATGAKNYPPDMRKIGDQGGQHDRFFEMNVGGRSIMFRYSPSVTGKAWDPSMKDVKPDASAITEVYDEEGQPLDAKTAWWHLLQDQYEDDHKEVEPLAGFHVGTGDTSDAGKVVKRNGLNERILQVIAQSNSAKGKGILESQEAAARATPVEMTGLDFRLRSGTFAYDNFEHAGNAELAKFHSATTAEGRQEALRALSKKQPGLATVSVRGKDGRFTKPMYVTDGDPPQPVYNSLRYVNTNPDGTSTVIKCTQYTGADGKGDASRMGKFFVENPMWAALLTPNGEDVRGPEHLAELCRSAAQDRRRAWISVKTDSVGGDTGHYYHVQVEFDGRGQPKILGDEWKRRLGKDSPRLDDLMTSGRVVDGAEVARPQVKGARIRLEEGQRRPKPGQGKVPGVGERTVLHVAGEEINRSEGRDVVVRLMKVVPGKKAGVVPSPPGWDRMPDGVPGEPGPHEGKPVSGKYTKREKELKKRGLLSKDYVATDRQRAWLKDQYEPAYAEWEATKDALTDQEIPPRYVFATEIGGGGVGGGIAGGRLFIRHGEADVIRDTREPMRSRKPVALEHDTLAYVHQKVDPIDGAIVSQEIRLLLPTDGTVTTTSIRDMHGVRLEKDGDGAYIQVSLDGFARLRESLGSLSLTSEAEGMLRAKVDGLNDLARQAKHKTHKIQISDITSEKLATGQVPGFGAVGIVQKFANGVDFDIATYQAEGIQRVVDNDGRGMLAHTMGTGKTVTAITLAKMMLAKTDPDDPSRKDPNAPKKVLIVAPLNTVEQWRQAADTFDSGCHVVGAGKNDIPAAAFVEGVAKGTYGNELVVCGPEYFTLNQAKLREAGFDGLIVDEAHQGIKNESSERNASVADWNGHMKMLVLLTGTPITTSPADLVEYVRILSQDEQWTGMTRAQFIDEFLEESSVPGEAGKIGGKGPKVQVKPGKMNELAAIVSHWMHVVAAKDVTGKTLPVVRTEETEHAEMTGVQSTLYAMHMAALSDDDKEQLAANAVLSADESSGLDGEQRKAVQAARATANCVAYKPESDEKYVSTYRSVPDDKGKVRKQKIDFTTFDPKWLTNRTIRKKAAGTKTDPRPRWPTADEMVGGDHEMLIYGQHLADVTGTSDYAGIAGTPITDEQMARMKADGWPRPIRNPESGPVGIRCRGFDEPAPPHPDTDQAMILQRTFGSLLRDGITVPDAKGRPVKQELDPTTALAEAARRLGVSVETAQAWLRVHPRPTTHRPSLTWGGVTVREGENWVSDTRGSLHLLYHPDDWDMDLHRPKSAGGFANVAPGSFVNLSNAAKYGIVPPKPPKGLTKEAKAQWLADNPWSPPALQYDEQATLDAKNGKVALRRADTGEIVWADKADVSAVARSLMDPGMRSERAKADIAMTVGNAKAEALRGHVQRFHQTTAPGPDGARQMVVFANGILDGCRTLEASFRMQGFRDVNEAIGGSPHADPTEVDPKSGTAPSVNGKYFVTYIGSTYTGNRELNVAIFQKRKDNLNRDTTESLFVHKCNVGAGKGWSAYPGDERDESLKLSQWTPEQRKQIGEGFKIRAPESYLTGDDGRKMYFYGTPRSAAILREIALAGDPTKQSAEIAARTRATIAGLKAEYAGIARKGAEGKPPLTDPQTHVFNNCEAILCSDAAQVGMNLGNGVEMVMYDSLSSPAAELQRMTRSARLLPPAIEEKLRPIVARIKAKEAALFDPGQRGQAPGIVAGLKCYTAAGTFKDCGDMTFGSALHFVRETALARAEAAADRKDVAASWRSIAAKAANAANMGANNAAQFFDELKNTKIPGGVENLIDYDVGRTVFPQPTKGTYDALDVSSPAAAINDYIQNELSPEDRAALMDTGHDAASLYIAMRAEEVLTWIEQERPKKSIAMRGAVGGKIITDADVNNALIDDLTPMDRAILKNKKYLVNVQRIGVSAQLPQTVKIDPAVAGGDEEEDEEDAESRAGAEKPEKAKVRSVFVGWEQQAPIAPEVNTRLTARARQTATEDLMRKVQEGVTVRHDLDYSTTTASGVSTASRLDLGKSLRFGIPASRVNPEYFRA